MQDMTDDNETADSDQPRELMSQDVSVSDHDLFCSKCSSVIELTRSAPDTGLRVTPMIPPRNSLLVGGVAPQ